MIQRKFQAPNFQCSAHDGDGKSYRWLTFAPSDEALRIRLENRGYTIDSIQTYDFASWLARAAEATERVLAAKTNDDPVVFDNRIWTELKLHLFEVFGEKCAYCEARILHVTSGDVEHYRPKRRVDEDEAHSGYFWLAYEVGNLLPCCEACNRSRGKSNHFPILGERAYDPSDLLDAEDPLMLNPYFDKPEEHLSFVRGIPSDQGVPKFLGTVEGISEKGWRTLEICNLRRPRLNEERKSKQAGFVDQLMLAMNRWNVDEICELWRELLMGDREYAGAILAQIDLLKGIGITCPLSPDELAELASLHLL